MTRDGRSATDDELPIVSRLVVRGSRGFSGTARAVLRLVPRSLLLLAWGVVPVGVFAGILTLSIRESPGADGVLTGLFAGLLTALLAALAMGMLVLWLHGPERKAPAADTATVGELERLLAPALRELERARKEVGRTVRRRSIVRVPAGMAAALVIWWLGQFGSDAPDAFDLVMWTIVGAFAGEVWAIGRLNTEYRRLYKTRVLPQLAARLGDLTYRHGVAHAAARARAVRMLRDFERVEAEDEIAGTYHGLPLSIVETRLVSGAGDRTQVVFDGLLVELTLPRTLTGTTLVVSDAGVVGNLKMQWRSDGLQRVRLEDPRFESRYEVYSSDQIEARALLTPAFMERFLALGRLPGLAPPGALAEGNRLTTALPKRMPPKDFFEPPSYWKPAGGEVLVTLSRDIEAVLAMADSVIELDFWAAGVRRASAPGPEPV